MDYTQRRGFIRRNHGVGARLLQELLVEHCCNLELNLNCLVYGQVAIFKISGKIKNKLSVKTPLHVQLI